MMTPRIWPPTGLNQAIEKAFSEDQPRDDHGRWTSGGDSGGGEKESKSPGVLNPAKAGIVAAHEDAIKYYEQKLANVQGSTPADEGIRGVYEDAIKDLKTRLASIDPSGAYSSRK